MVVPNKSLEQRLTALAHGNEIRIKRANLKRDIKAGRANVKSLLADPPEWLETMKVFELLLAEPKVGRVKANKYMNSCRISPSKTVGGMSERQRHELIMAVR